MSKYVIIIDDEIYGYTNNKKDTICTMKILSDNLLKIEKEKKPYKEYFQRHLEDKIEISCIKRGIIFDGRLRKIHIIRYEEIDNISIKNTENVPKESTHKKIILEDDIRKDSDNEKSEKYSEKNVSIEESEEDDYSCSTESESSSEIEDLFEPQTQPQKQKFLFLPPTPKLMKTFVRNF